MKHDTTLLLCPDCLGDGIETCHNPDHGFIGYSEIMNAFKSANESACPCCGHSENHKMSGTCFTCNGTGRVSKREYEAYNLKY